MRSWKWISLLAIALLLTPPVVPAPATGTDGSGFKLNLGIGRVGASLVFEENWREDLPYNPDRTLYPGDSFRLDLGVLEGDASRIAEAYRFTAEGQELSVNASNWVRIPENAEPGQREVVVRAEPRPATLRVTLVIEEDYAKARSMRIDFIGPETETLDLEAAYGKETYYRSIAKEERKLPQGAWRIVCYPVEASKTYAEGERWDNYLPPPPLELNLNSGRSYEVEGRYRKNQEGYWATYQSDNSVTYLQPAEGKVLVRVVPYRPKFTVIPYIALAKDSGDDPYCYWKPGMVLVRYDGNAYDLENEERLSLQQRAVVQDFSSGGTWIHVKRAEKRKEQLRDYASPEDKGKVVIQIWGIENGVSKGYCGLTPSSGSEFQIYTGPIAKSCTSYFSVPRGSICFISLDNMRAGGRICEGPPPFYILAECGTEGKTIVEVRYVENRAAEVSVEGGTLNPPPSADQVYRRNENYEILFYEPGDIEVTDMGIPVLAYENLEAKGTLASPRLEGGGRRWALQRAVTAPPSPSGLRWVTAVESASGPGEEPPVFWENQRYAKYSFTPVRGESTEPRAGELDAVNFYQSISFRGNPTFDFSLLWEPIGDRENVEVRFWRLKERVWWNGEEENVLELIQPDNHPEAVMDENLWEVDSTASKKILLIPLFRIRETAEHLRDSNVLTLLRLLGLENTAVEDLCSPLRAGENATPLLENYLQTFGVRGTSSSPVSAKLLETLFSDNYLFSNYIEDTTAENEPSFELETSEGVLCKAAELWGNERKELEARNGSVELKRYGGTTFLLMLDNIISVVGIPFNPENSYKMGFSLTGGYSVKVLEDLPWETHLRFYFSPLAGSLGSLRIYQLDEKGERIGRVYEWPPDILVPLRKSPILGAGLSPPEELTLAKFPGLTHIEVEFTNELGGRQSYRLHLSPYAGREEVAMVRLIWILLLALLASFAWLQIWRRIRRPKEL
jgi:hypothetical protein